MGVPRLKHLKDLLEDMAKARRDLYLLNKKQLISLRSEFLESSSLKATRIWFNILERGNWRLVAENVRLIRRVYRESRHFERLLDIRIEDIEESEALHMVWEERLLPVDVPPTEKFEPEYPLASSYESDDLSRFVDESWLPDDISVARG